MGLSTMQILAHHADIKKRGFEIPARVANSRGNSGLMTRGAKSPFPSSTGVLSVIPACQAVARSASVPGRDLRAYVGIASAAI